MSRAYDAAVVGLGVVGSATAAALAERGLAVLGLDRFAPPHELGSSHGESRMIREAYFEAPFYVPLVQEAYARWRDLESAAGRELLHETGGLMIGPPDGDLVRGCLESAGRHELPHEVLSRDDVGARHPAFRLPAGSVAVHEPRAGFLIAEDCVDAFLALARARGADLRTGQPLERWSRRDGLIVLRTSEAEYRARRLLLAAGAWTRALCPDLALPLRVSRVVQHWFRPRADAEALEPGRCPVWAWEYAPDRIWYGFPALSRGVKVGLHHGTPAASADDVRREVSAQETAELSGRLERRLPAAAGSSAGAEVCLYTETPDGHFLIDRHPAAPEVVIASACSGHGFKFASALGPLLADLLTDERPDVDLAPFSLSRF